MKKELIKTGTIIKKVVVCWIIKDNETGEELPIKSSTNLIHGGMTRYIKKQNISQGKYENGEFSRDIIEEEWAEIHK